MKNFKMSLIVLIVSFFVNTVSAQQSVILNKKTSRTNDNTTVTIKFDVDKITSAAQAETFRSKMEASVATKGKVTVGPLVAGKSSYVFMFKRKEFKLEHFQNALLAAGLNDVVIDGQKMKTNTLVAKSAKK
ncbi:MAG TPA: hypothetical protein VGC65_10400 [Bacteroidia bacterium]|jgi:hypothetical protein